MLDDFEAIEVETGDTTIFVQIREGSAAPAIARLSSDAPALSRCWRLLQTHSEICDRFCCKLFSYTSCGIGLCCFPGRP